MTKPLVDIACEIRMDRPGSKAIAIADGTTELAKGADGVERQRQKWFWLPRSLIEVETAPDGSAVVIMPEWLAVEKGLV